MITATIIYTDGSEDVRYFGAWNSFSRFVDENAGAILSAFAIMGGPNDGE